jgi:hypothetical protein
MNFSTHKNKIIESIETALSKRKTGIVDDFKHILVKSSSLFKTNEFDFWLQQIGQIDLEEIPITHDGLNEAKRTLSSLKNSDRHQLCISIKNICEMLFSYCDEDNSCEMQGYFYYYFHIPSNRVFRESGFGVIEPKIEIGDYSEVRIAKVSELFLEKCKLLNSEKAVATDFNNVKLPNRIVGYKTKMKNFEIIKMANGALTLCLQSNITWSEFPQLSKEWAKALNAKCINNPIISFDECILEVEIEKSLFLITYDDFQEGLHLEPKSKTSDNIIIKIQKSLKGSK